jgi:hypothetical protein
MRNYLDMEAKKKKKSTLYIHLNNLYKASRLLKGNLFFFYKFIFSFFL